MQVPTVIIWHIIQETIRLSFVQDSEENKTDDEFDIDSAFGNSDGVDSAVMVSLQGYVPPEMSNKESIDPEQELVASFMCNCKMAPGGLLCSSLFSHAVLYDLRDQFCEIDYYENHSNKLDLVMLGILQTPMYSGSSTRGKKRKAEERQERTTFMVCGEKFCEMTFLFCHTMSCKWYK